MPVDTFAASLRALLDDYDARGSRLTELEQADAELRAQLATLQAENVRLTALLASVPPVEPEPPTLKLKYAPPALDNPITLTISKAGTVTLDQSRDYILECPNTLDGALAIVGGRNVVAIGGHVRIPHQGANPSINQRRGLLIRDTRGVFHGEGWLFDGEDISEGIQIDAPEATVQLQNIRIDHVHARDQVNFKDNHPDLVQTWGNVRELRIDRFTGSTDYQGFLFKADYNNADGHGAVFVSRANIAADPTGRYLFWVHPSANSKPVTLADVWLDVHPSRAGGLGKSVWTDVDNTTYPAILSTDAGGNPIAYWNNHDPAIQGHITQGIPPGGDFVPAGVAGLNYVSPGYWSDPEATPTPTMTITPTDEPPAPTVPPQWSFTVYFSDGFTAAFWCDLTADLLERFNVLHDIACPGG